jgi:hypothetical protein
MTWHLYRNSESIYCAESLEAAAASFLADMEGDVEDLGEAPFEQIPDDEDLEIGCEDPHEVPGEIERRVRQKDGDWGVPHYFLTKKAGVWAEGYAFTGCFSGGDY